MPSRKKNTTFQRHADSRFDLNALFEFSAILNSSLELKFILDHLLLTVMGKILATRGIILLEKKNHTFVVESVKGLPAELVGKAIAIKRIPIATNRGL